MATITAGGTWVIALAHRDVVSIAAIAAAIVKNVAVIAAVTAAAIAGVADGHRLTVLRRPAAPRRRFRGDPEHTELRLERWCSIGKT